MLLGTAKCWETRNTAIHGKKCHNYLHSIEKRSGQERFAGGLGERVKQSSESYFTEMSAQRV